MANTFQDHILDREFTKCIEYIRAYDLSPGIVNHAHTNIPMLFATVWADTERKAWVAEFLATMGWAINGPDGLGQYTIESV